VSHPKAVTHPDWQADSGATDRPRAPAAHVAGEMGVSRATAYRWWHRYVQEAMPVCSTGARGRAQPTSDLSASGATDRGAAAAHQAGPDSHWGAPPHAGLDGDRVLVRQQLNRLSWMDRPTGV